MTISTERGVLSVNPIHAIIWTGNFDVIHVVLGNIQRWFPLAFRRFEWFSPFGELPIMANGFHLPWLRLMKLGSGGTLLLAAFTRPVILSSLGFCGIL